MTENTRQFIKDKAYDKQQILGADVAIQGIVSEDGTMGLYGTIPVVFLLNRNLGGAVIFNRKIHKGVSMRNGVIEHICVDPEGPECYCDCKGCLETYCSADALENISGMPAYSFFLKLR